MECRKCRNPFEPTSHQIKKHDWLCLVCRRANDREWRERRKAAGFPVVSTKMPREWQRNYEKEYLKSPEHRARRAELMARYRKDPVLAIRHDARRMTRNAIRTGRLVKQPCSVCGNPDVQAHHEDYMKPLDIIWLCKACHVKHHTKAEG